MKLDKPKYIILGETYFRFKLDYNESNKKIIKQALHKVSYNFEIYNYNKKYTKITVEFREGSIKTNIVIWAPVLYFAIGHYGDFRSGVDQILNDSRIFSEYISNIIISDPQISMDDIARIEKRKGIPGRIKEIYNQIDSIQRNVNDLTPNQMSIRLNEIKQKISNLSWVLSQNDQQSLLNSLPSEYTTNLPEPNEENTNYLINRYGLKPDEEIERLENL